MEIKKFFPVVLGASISLFASEGWDETQLVWNFGILPSCNVGVPENPRHYFLQDPIFKTKYYQNIKRGDVVWVQPSLVADFYEKVFPEINVPIVLVISDGDASFPSDCLKKEAFDELLESKNIIHIFAQNCDYQGNSKKISPIPIGIDFHTVAYKGTTGGWGMLGSPQDQESYLLKNLKNAPPTSQRKCRAFVDFQHSDTMHGEFKRHLQCGEDRISIFNTIKNSGVVDYGEWMPRGHLWKKKADYAFSISPHGNGLDCHRTWEDLALGCIVIVKSSPIDALFEGLPVIIIQDWSEINEENFHKWLLMYQDASTNPNFRERLTNRYWITKIINTVTAYKSHD